MPLVAVVKIPDQPEPESLLIVSVLGHCGGRGLAGYLPGGLFKEKPGVGLTDRLEPLPLAVGLDVVSVGLEGAPIGRVSLMRHPRALGRWPS